MQRGIAELQDCGHRARRLEDRGHRPPRGLRDDRRAGARRRARRRRLRRARRRRAPKSRSSTGCARRPASRATSGSPSAARSGGTRSGATSTAPSRAPTRPGRSPRGSSERSRCTTAWRRRVETLAATDGALNGRAALPGRDLRVVWVRDRPARPGRLRDPSGGLRVPGRGPVRDRALRPRRHAGPVAGRRHRRGRDPPRRLHHPMVGPGRRARRARRAHRPPRGEADDEPPRVGSRADGGSDRGRFRFRLPPLPERRPLGPVRRRRARPLPRPLPRGVTNLEPGLPERRASRRRRELEAAASHRVPAVRRVPDRVADGTGRAASIRSAFRTSLASRTTRPGTATTRR